MKTSQGLVIVPLDGSMRRLSRWLFVLGMCKATKAEHLSASVAG
jgi:hypothetical protein